MLVQRTVVIVRHASSTILLKRPVRGRWGKIVEEAWRNMAFIPAHVGDEPVPIKYRTVYFSDWVPVFKAEPGVEVMSSER